MLYVCCLIQLILPVNEEEIQKPWLKKNSKPHSALQKVVLSKRFLNTFHYYTNFRLVIFLYVTFSTITKGISLSFQANFELSVCTLYFIVCGITMNVVLIILDTQVSLNPFTIIC